MKRFLTLLVIGIAAGLKAQTPYHFPQAQIDQNLNDIWQKVQTGFSQPESRERRQGIMNNSPGAVLYRHEKLSSLSAKFDNIHNLQQRDLSDTIFLGFSPPDTLFITGTWTHTGPIIIGGNGVLMAQNATMTNIGDVYVFQNGQFLADSSTMNFPQEYVYQRSLIVVQNGQVSITHSSLNYGGLSHSWVVSDSGSITLQHVHNYDWTTAGLYRHGQVHLTDINLAGEYIFKDSCQASFNQTTQLLLWHQFPDSANINFSFPDGDFVNSYQFNKNVAGVQGIEYEINLDSCHQVMWGMMPVNGSNVHISNSTLRTIGLWFEHGDQATVNGLVNNSTYSNFTAPLNDRVLTLTNCDLQTWSLYSFDSASVDITGGCILGEVGSQGTSMINASNFYLDGSGGYYWTNDTSFNLTGLTAVGSNIRSEGMSTLVFAYGTEAFGVPSAIKKSLLVTVQSNLTQEPVAYDGAAVWDVQITQPSTALIDTLVPISGSAFISQGPLGNPMSLNSYRLYYQMPDDTSWIPIGTSHAENVHNGTLETWDTHGLAFGNYLLQLRTKNNFGDSISANKSVNLIEASVLSVQQNEFENSNVELSPNPANDRIKVSFALKNSRKVDMRILDITGRVVQVFNPVYYAAGKQQIKLSIDNLNLGVYFLQLETDRGRALQKFVVER